MVAVGYPISCKLGLVNKMKHFVWDMRFSFRGDEDLSL